MATKTFPITASLPVNTSGEANPGDSHLPMGKWDPGTGLSWVTRVLLKASISFAGMSAINEARVYFYAHTASGWHANGSGTVGISAYRKTADWSEASGGSTATDEVWGGSYASLVTANYVAESGDFSNSINADAADGALVYIPITSMVRKWFEGTPNYGALIVAGPAESNSAKSFEAYSRRVSGKVPYIWIDYSANTAPNAPTGLSPTGDEVTQTGRTIPLSFTGSDPDAGDYLTAYQAQLTSDAGTLLVDTGEVLTPSHPTSVIAQVTLPAGSDAGNPYYKWRARTRDKDSVWGPYSAYQRFRPNSVPTTPVGPTVESDTLTPAIGGSYADPDPAAPGSTFAFVEVEVDLAVAPYTSMWAPGPVAKSASPWSVAYAGTPLAWGGGPYRARYRLTDGLAGVSAWGSYTQWSPTAPSGPNNMTPRTTTAKQNTLTPTLNTAHSVTFRNHQLEVYAANDLGSTKLWTKAWVGADYAAATTKADVYAGTALAWGGTYWWRAQVELSADGTVTAWSALVPFRINALPTTPTLAVANTDGSPAVDSSGVKVVVVARPVLSCPFTDPDVATDGDTPSARSIEVRRKDTQAALAGYPVTTGTTTTHTLGTDLTAEVVYQVRWGYRDSAGQPAGSYTYSPWVEVRRSAAPVIAAVSPGASVTDSTPDVVWTLTPTAGKVQATSQVKLFDLGPTGALYPGGEVPVHDSGVRVGTSMTYTIPAGVVLNGHRYRWEVQATDADGLAATLV